MRRCKELRVRFPRHYAGEFELLHSESRIFTDAQNIQTKLPRVPILPLRKDGAVVPDRSRRNNRRLACTNRFQSCQPLCSQGYFLGRDRPLRPAGSPGENRFHSIKDFQLTNKFLGHANVLLAQVRVGNLRLCQDGFVFAVLGDEESPRRVSRTLRHLAWEFTDLLRWSFRSVGPAC